MPVATRRSGQTSSDPAKPPAPTPAKRPHDVDDVAAVRPPKRKRPNAPASKTPHKQRVGNESESMMTLPIEIFIQVLDYATPCALVALIRTNKTFRRILLNPSARPLWQAAESRVPGLPCCPSWMSEPRYAALLFSNLCTICGAVTTLKLDTHLFVRLCASCRKTEVVEYNKVRQGRTTAHFSWLSWSNEIKPNNSRSYALRREVDQILEEYTELLKSKNRPNLQRWESKKSNESNARYQFRWRLAEYLNNVEKAHQQEMKAIKEQRRQLIYERLQTLGWAGEDIKIDDAYTKPWKALVDIPQPLSDKACTTLMPKLIALLRKNRKHKELQARREKTQELLAEYKRDVHHFESLLKLLGQGTPPLVVNPLPDMAIILEWDNVKELYEPDMPIETISPRFTESLSRFENALATWRKGTELQLINNLDLEGKPDARTVLKIQESTASTKKLSPDTRFLLRADTIFKAPPIEQNQASQWYNPGPHTSRPTIHSLYYYPDLLIPPEGAKSGVKPEDLADLSRFTRHTEAELIAKALLASLGIPDVAYIELKAIGARLTCGRCYNKRSMTWENIVEHYREMNERWEKEAKYQREQQTRHKITFINSHDFTTGAGSSKPLVSLEGILDGRTPSDELECKLCLVGWRSTTYDSKPGITVHLENVHAISGQLVEGLHYGARTETAVVSEYRKNWRKRWDWHHDKATSLATASHS